MVNIKIANHTSIPFDKNKKIKTMSRIRSFLGLPDPDPLILFVRIRIRLLIIQYVSKKINKLMYTVYAPAS
jgi:hypothetical protein